MNLILEDIEITTVDNRPLLTSVNACFEPGVTALVGHNGSGKSTLLRTIATLHPLAKGVIRLDELDNIRHKAAFLERLVFMPQNFMAYPELTGVEFLEYALLLRGGNRRQARKIAETWADAVGLAHAARNRTGTYSQGMLQRLGFAYAMQINVSMHLLDEPFSGVDPEARNALMDILFSACAEQIVIVSTHHIDEMAQRGATIVRLRDGELAKSCQPHI